MYAVVRRYPGVELGRMEELWRRVNEGFLPIVRGVPGFVAYYAFDAGGGTAVSVSIFEDQAGATESTRRAADWVREQLAGLYSGEPEVMAGETTVQAAG